MRCSQCVLSDRTPNITFDREGVCNYCHTYQGYDYQGEAALQRLLDEFRDTGGQYDCLVGLSGGRDSSYTLLKLVKDYGMNVLAVNYQNPFTVPQARANIENAVKTLNVDLVQFTAGSDAHVKAFRQAVQAWFRKPSPALIPLMCVGCKPAWLPIYRVAKKHGIHLIISGGNPYEVISFKRELVNISRDENPDSAFFKYIYSVRQMLDNLGYFRPHLVLSMIKAYLYGNPRSLGLRWLGRNITWIELFNYIPWDERQIVPRIQQELNWTHPPQLKSTWRFDCRVHHLVDLMYLQTLHMTDTDDFYAKMVREGFVSRQEALQKVEDANEIHWDEIQLLLNQAGFQDTSFLPEPAHVDGNPVSPG